MICDFCKKEYKEAHEIVYAFGNKFCMHDEQLKLFNAVNGMGNKNDSLSANVIRSGKNKTEEKYIQTNKQKGNTVVRGSDGLLRAIGQGE